jgi:hypothetical protein
MQLERQEGMLIMVSTSCWSRFSIAWRLWSLVFPDRRNLSNLINGLVEGATGVARKVIYDGTAH